MKELLKSLSSKDLNLFVETANWVQEVITEFQSDPENYWTNSNENWECLDHLCYETIEDFLQNYIVTKEVASIIQEHVIEFRGKLSSMNYYDRRRTPKTRLKLIRSLL